MSILPKNRSLKTLREQRRLILSDVADFAKISAQRLQMFEEGRGNPSLRQLEQLAQIYGVPVYAFFGNSIPNVPEIPVDFRKRDIGPAEISPRGLKRLLGAEKISTFADQLAVELRDTPPNWTSSIQRTASVQERAGSLRNIFDDWFARHSEELELNGPLHQRFLLALRLFFEAQGGVINIQDAPATDYMGFFMAPDGAREIIFVNRSISSKKAQLFTLAHEYAHALTNQQGISNPFVVRNPIERECNAFAAEFLAPMAAFRPLVEGQPRTVRSNVSEFVSIISAYSLLSKHATAIRLAEAGYISEQQLRDWEGASAFRGSEKTEEAEETGTVNFGWPHAKRLGELGYFPIFLAAEALERKIIDSIDVQVGIGLSESLQTSAFALARRRLVAARR
jgi:Zn-dependent peptidase ImmA (M78 family)/DNA-binding XRE family transcriptional regulator